MFDVGLLKGVNVVLLRSVTVNLAELWRATSRYNFVTGFFLYGQDVPLIRCEKLSISGLLLLFIFVIFIFRQPIA